MKVVTEQQLMDDIKGFIAHAESRTHRSPTKMIVKCIMLAEARLLLAQATQEQRAALRWEDDGGRG